MTKRYLHIQLISVTKLGLSEAPFFLAEVARRYWGGAIHGWSKETTRDYSSAPTFFLLFSFLLFLDKAKVPVPPKAGKKPPPAVKPAGKGRKTSFS